MLSEVGSWIMGYDEVSYPRELMDEGTKAQTKTTAAASEIQTCSFRGQSLWHARVGLENQYENTG